MALPAPPQPAHTDHTGIPPNAPTVANRSTAMHQNVYTKDIYLNGTKVGATIPVSQWLNLQTKDGTLMPVLVVWDSASDHSHITYTLQDNSLTGLQEKYYNLNTINSTKMCKGLLGTYRLHSQYNGMCVDIECFSQEFVGNHVNKKTVNIPPEWRTQFNLQPQMDTNQGFYSILVGLDNQQLEPFECGPRVGKLKIMQSAIDNQIMISGALTGIEMEQNNHFSSYHVYPQIICNRTKVNIDTEEYLHEDLIGYPQDISTSDERNLASWAGTRKFCELSRREDQTKPKQIVTGPDSRNLSTRTKSINVPSCDSDTEIVITSKVPISADRERFLKALETQDIFLHPPICKECSQRSQKCTKCQEEIGLCPQARFEKQILLEGLSLDNEGHWVVSGRYRTDITKVPTYFDSCQRFQLGLERKLRRQPEVLENLNKQMDRRFQNGTFRFLADLKKENPNVQWEKFQLILSPMTFVRKSTSARNAVRPCINQSWAPGPQDITLNSCRFKGCHDITNMMEILLWFRSWRYVSTSDVIDFFTTVKLDHATMMQNCFLYRREGWASNSPLEIAVCAKLYYGATDSVQLSRGAFFLTAEKHIKPVHPEAAAQLKNAVMDDLLVGAQTVKERDKMKISIRDGLLKNHFKIQPWTDNFTNDADDIILRNTTDENSPLLGLVWRCARDVFIVNAKVNLEKKNRGARNENTQIEEIEDIPRVFGNVQITRRVCLRISACLWDPLGNHLWLKNQMNLLFREIIQELSENNERTGRIDWEEPIPEKYIPDVMRNVQYITECRKIEIPRFALEGVGGEKPKCDIYVSTDGSSSSSSARAFVIYRDVNGKLQSNYILGMARLAQKTDSTAPRTECVGILLGARILKLIHKNWGNQVEIVNSYICSDSQCALSGLVSSIITQKQFFALRNSEARAIVEEFSVKLLYCESQYCDADESTKPQNKNISLSPVWWRGKFLQSETWPTRVYQYQPAHSRYILNPKNIVENKQEVDMHILNTNIALTANSEDIFVHNVDNEIVDTETRYEEYRELVLHLLKKFQSFEKCKKSLAYIMKWKSKDYLFTALQKAEKVLLQLFVPDKTVLAGAGRYFEIVEGQDGFKALPRTFVKNGIAKQEVLHILDGSSELGKYFLKDLHIHQTSVANQQMKMYEKGYLVTKSYKILKKISENCSFCKRLKLEIFNQRMGSQLQTQAEKELDNFSACQLDMAGPFKCSLGKGKPHKIYFCLVTCLISRFTLIIPQQKMTSNDTLQSLLSAFYQVGKSSPCLLYADRGANITTLMKLEKQEEFDPEDDNIDDNLIKDLKRTLQKANISLQEGSPYASFRQGLVEAMVKRFKEALKKSNLAHQTHNIFVWWHIAFKMQYIINSRVLNAKYVTDSSYQLVTPITMNFGNRKTDNYLQEINLENLNNQELNLYRKQKQINAELQHFRDLWVESYGKELRLLHKWKKKHSGLKKGDIVLLKSRMKINKTALGEIQETVGERKGTYSIQIVKKNMVIDPKSFQMKKTAKKTNVIRPIQDLVYICSKEERDNNDIIEVENFENPCNALNHEEKSANVEDEEENNLTETEGIDVQEKTNPVQEIQRDISKENNKENVEEITQEDDVNNENTDTIETNNINNGEGINKDTAGIITHPENTFDDSKAEDEQREERNKNDRTRKELQPTTSGRKRYLPRKFL